MKIHININGTSFYQNLFLLCAVNINMSLYFSSYFYFYISFLIDFHLICTGIVFCLSSSLCITSSAYLIIRK
ncbi:hypothetical protein XELAEV_18016593mg [Xenopus laevis]|uniref:Uncharacterized protein n=1 Tax=Xenopus laevis TaxID=8355 RepID=A0A974HRX0_XENLA|nr:hypothetical protein XELAEV_18016593mg [Xenopus laevis]